MNQTNSEGPSIESDGTTLVCGVQAESASPSAPIRTLRKLVFGFRSNPGYRVFYEGYPAKLVIERDGKVITQ
jgi:hypothetical protein